IDIGSTMHMAAINPNADDPVREFGTFTGDLHDMARWVRIPVNVGGVSSRSWAAVPGMLGSL
ncbi:MAG: hypothetical protein ABI040_10095, partial [Rhodoferax sp.]